MRIVIYARVSTKDQSCDLQLRDLRAYCAARGISVLREYVDIGESGAKDSRPQLNELMAAARKRQFDALVVSIEKGRLRPPGSRELEVVVSRPRFHRLSRFGSKRSPF